MRGRGRKHTGVIRCGGFAIKGGWKRDRLPMGQGWLEGDTHRWLALPQPPPRPRQGLVPVQQDWCGDKPPWPLPCPPQCAGGVSDPSGVGAAGGALPGCNSHRPSRNRKPPNQAHRFLPSLQTHKPLRSPLALLPRSLCGYPFALAHKPLREVACLLSFVLAGCVSSSVSCFMLKRKALPPCRRAQRFVALIMPPIYLFLLVCFPGRAALSFNGCMTGRIAVKHTANSFSGIEI